MPGRVPRKLSAPPTELRFDGIKRSNITSETTNTLKNAAYLSTEFSEVLQGGDDTTSRMSSTNAVTQSRHGSTIKTDTAQEAQQLRNVTGKIHTNATQSNMPRPNAPPRTGSGYFHHQLPMNSFIDARSTPGSISMTESKSAIQLQAKADTSVVVPDPALISVSTNTLLTFKTPVAPRQILGRVVFEFDPSRSYYHLVLMDDRRSAWVHKSDTELHSMIPQLVDDFDRQYSKKGGRKGAIKKDDLHLSAVRPPFGYPAYGMWDKNNKIHYFGSNGFADTEAGAQAEPVENDPIPCFGRPLQRNVLEFAREPKISRKSAAGSWSYDDNDDAPKHTEEAKFQAAAADNNLGRGKRPKKPQSTSRNTNSANTTIKSEKDATSQQAVLPKLSSMTPYEGELSSGRKHHHSGGSAAGKLSDNNQPKEASVRIDIPASSPTNTTKKSGRLQRGSIQTSVRAEAELLDNNGARSQIQPHNPRSSSSRTSATSPQIPIDIADSKKGGGSISFTNTAEVRFLDEPALDSKSVTQKSAVHIILRCERTRSSDISRGFPKFSSSIDTKVLAPPGMSFVEGSRDIEWNGSLSITGSNLYLIGWAETDKNGVRREHRRFVDAEDILLYVSTNNKAAGTMALPSFFDAGNDTFPTEHNGLNTKLRSEKLDAKRAGYRVQMEKLDNFQATENVLATLGFTVKPKIKHNSNNRKDNKYEYPMTETQLNWFIEKDRLRKKLKKQLSTLDAEFKKADRHLIAGGRLPRSKRRDEETGLELFDYSKVTFPGDSEDASSSGCDLEISTGPSMCAQDQELKITIVREEEISFYRRVVTVTVNNLPNWIDLDLKDVQDRVTELGPRFKDTKCCGLRIVNQTYEHGEYGKVMLCLSWRQKLDKDEVLEERDERQTHTLKELFSTKRSAAPRPLKGKVEKASEGLGWRAVPNHLLSSYAPAPSLALNDFQMINNGTEMPQNKSGGNRVNPARSLNHGHTASKELTHAQIGSRHHTSHSDLPSAAPLHGYIHREPSMATLSSNHSKRKSAFDNPQPSRRSLILDRALKSIKLRQNEALSSQNGRQHGDTTTYGNAATRLINHNGTETSELDLKNQYYQAPDAGKPPLQDGIIGVLHQDENIEVVKDGTMFGQLQFNQNNNHLLLPSRREAAASPNHANASSEVNGDSVDDNDEL